MNEAFRLPGSSGRGNYNAAQCACKVVQDTRTAVADFFGIRQSERVIFTQNATEAVNVGLKGLLKRGDHVLISSLEHNAIVRPLEYLKKQGVSYTVAPVSVDGEWNQKKWAAHKRAETKMLCVTHASNVTGGILPIGDMSDFAHKNGWIFVVDAAQSAGVLPVDAEALNIDFMVFTGHKGLMGPQGAGGFFARDGLMVESLIQGGTGILSQLFAQPEQWPEGMESGTRNQAGLAALEAGVRFIQSEGLERIRRHEMALTARLIEGLAQTARVSVIGSSDPGKRIGLVSFNIEGQDANQAADRLDKEFDLQCRAGLHCAPLAHLTAGTFRNGAIRLSVGYFQKEDDIDQALDAIRWLAAHP
jgi:cysteine desulfurase family protein